MPTLPKRCSPAAGQVRRWSREVTVPMTTGLPPQSDPNLEYVGHPNYNLNELGVAIAMDAVELTVAGKTMTKPVSARDLLRGRTVDEAG